jgi:26S proteasome regulatory subunit N6
MLLCKIMTNCSEEVPGLIDGKSGLKYAGPDLEAMREMAAAYQTRSLEKLIAAQERFAPQVSEDPVTKFHLTNLYDALLEQNLARLVEPFSQVWTSFTLLSHFSESRYTQARVLSSPPACCRPAWPVL